MGLAEGAVRASLLLRGLVRLVLRSSSCLLLTTPYGARSLPFSRSFRFSFHVLIQIVVAELGPDLSGPLLCATLSRLPQLKKVSAPQQQQQQRPLPASRGPGASLASACSRAAGVHVVHVVAETA